MTKPQPKPYGVQPVRVMAAEGVTLATKLRRLERYVKNVAAGWEGSQLEYNEWAVGVVQRARLFNHVYAEEQE